VAFLKESGPVGDPEKLIKMATGQRRRRLRLEAAAAAARCSIALLLRRPSVNPLSKSAFGRSSTFRPHREAATTGMAIQHEPC
jgi:hypothetical protein